MKRAGILRPWAVFVWLLVWQIGAMALDQQILLVSPIQVLARLGELALQGSFWKAVGFSMLRITGGFLLGAAVGTVLAAFSARLRLVEELLQGHVEAAFRQNVYMFFVLPLAALWLVGEAACYLGGRRPLWKRRWMQALLVCVAAAGVAFTVLRNLPGLECLQPHGL